MAEDLRQNWAQVGVVLSTGLNSLANGSGADSAMQTLGTGHVSAGDQQGPFEIVGEALLAGTASSTVRCDIYWKASRDGTNASDNLNGELVASVQMNGTSTVRKHFRSPPLSYPSGIVRLVNSSGAALAASGNTVTIDKVTGDLV